MQVIFKLLENGVLPKKQTHGSAGYDLYSAVDIVVPSMECCLVSLGFKMALEHGYEAQVRSRSGLSKHKVFVLNSPGTIDADYRGEIAVLLMNLSKEDFQIKRGFRIAQMVFGQYCSPDMVIVDELPESERVGGWGSTGGF